MLEYIYSVSKASR